MKALIATAVVAVGLLSSTLSAQAGFEGYSGWARQVFEQSQNH